MFEEADLEIYNAGKRQIWYINTNTPEH